MAGDHYKTLGVPETASSQDIKRAFRQIAKECHPDVAGDDAAAIARFQAAREAYEVLSDDATRARYDRRLNGTGAPRGSFFQAFYERSGAKPVDRPKPTPTGAAHDAGGHASNRRRDARANDVSLDALLDGFGDFGYGAGPMSGPRPLRDPAPEPTVGADVQVDVGVPPAVIARGGSVSVAYTRLQRVPGWRPGTKDPGVVRVEDVADVRVLPGTRDLEVVRERGLGDAGAFGGPYGDLLVRVRIIGVEPPAEPPQRAPAPAPTEAARPEPAATIEVDITVVEALLGGRVPVDTPTGPVKVAIPPGTSSGARLRLRGRGPAGPGGPTDLSVVLRVVVPASLPEEAARLIEQFASLVPGQRRE